VPCHTANTPDAVYAFWMCGPDAHRIALGERKCVLCTQAQAAWFVRLVHMDLN